MKAIEAAGPVVHLRHEDPRCPLRRGRSGGGSTRARRSPTGTSSPSPGPPGRKDKRRDQVVYYQYRADRARRTLHGIDEQVAKAAKAVAGLAPVKRNRFIAAGGRGQERQPRTGGESHGPWPGSRGTRPTSPPPRTGSPVTADFVISSYHELWQIEKSFRMSKHDLQARPIYHHKRESIEAHLTDRLRRPRRHPARSRPGPAGRSRSSSAPPAGTAPSRSAPDSTPSPPKTRSRPTSATPSHSSNRRAQTLRTNLIRVRAAYIHDLKAAARTSVPVEPGNDCPEPRPTVSDAAMRIRAHDYRPNPGDRCRGCEVRTICKYARR